MSLIFGSVCSGIEAASVAFNPLGWKAAWFSEVDPFCSALLRHHYPHVPNWGDMNLLRHMIRAGLIAAPDVLCGGTPCQAFSVAGLRESLNDARGNLTLEFVKVADAIDQQRAEPCVVLWENVPGVLSTKDNAFGAFLGGLVGECHSIEPPIDKPPPGKNSKHWRWGGVDHAPAWPDAGLVVGPTRTAAWRVFDAQYFGLAQRRRRVFVVASARKGFDPGSVLFEWDGVRRDTAPSRETRQDAAGGAGHSTAFGGNNTSGPINVSPALNACSSSSGRLDFESEAFLVARTLRGEGFDASEGGTGRGTPLVPVAFQSSRPGVRLDPMHATLDSNSGSRRHNGVMAFHWNAQADQLPCEGRDMSVASALTRSQEVAAVIGLHVRRLTPRECERIQGFQWRCLPNYPGAWQDAAGQWWSADYTRLPTWKGWRKMDPDETPEGCRQQGMEVRQNRKTGAWRVRDVDGPRYKALGNSWAIPNIRWIGERIAFAVNTTAILP